MTDSPAIQASLDPKEEPIFGNILSLRDKLLLLKEDRSTHIKSQDVLDLYDQVIEQVHLLNNIREEYDKPLEHNRGSCVTDGPIIGWRFETVHENNNLASSGQCARGLLPTHFPFLPHYWTK